LPEGHLAWFVIDAVEEMDLAAFYRAYRDDGRSRPAYDPAMMVGLLLYAYARAMRSSRAIERACEEDVAFRVIAAQQQPDHATIARFIERHQDAIAGLFSEVLALCAKSGLAKVGVIAVDGTKLHANASRDANLDQRGSPSPGRRARRGTRAHRRADRPAARGPRAGQGTAWRRARSRRRSALPRSRATRPRTTP